MSERFKELVLKTSDSKEPWVRIPSSPPNTFNGKLNIKQDVTFGEVLKWWRGAPAKGVGWLKTGARVRVPPSPPKNTVGQSPAVFFYEFGLEPLEKTTALIKRFGESFLAGEICESKRSDRNFGNLWRRAERASAEQINKILRSKNLIRVPPSPPNKKDIRKDVFFVLWKRTRTSTWSESSR